ncbi:VWA domain-containing protein [Oscillatoria sp. FACHB-1406]|uniref:vWA domain-containing protein n=1 Tax=Oscillatoria sp. FACHB-1406 TaxID=2692846 RepID=UPI0016891CCB|nr:VWA domain-containing protein [Oscillatoria sp. FACHB-1406]MBD2577950.1 VWA domain-containing protein [Oscillatoria sp. FACHB-1406]
MKVSLQPILSDSHLDATQNNSQRQLSISLAAVSEGNERLPLNLCLVLDHSGSMEGEPLRTVKSAAIALLEKLNPSDRISLVAFDHRAKTIVPNQEPSDIGQIERQIEKLRADGGTAIDEGIKLGLEEVSKGKQDNNSQIFLLTDGENEHGDNKRCVKLAEIASENSITLNALGFGKHWNQDVLERIADTAGGALSYIETPEQATNEFGRLFQRAQSVGLTNAHLVFELMPNVRLAELKPIAQVAPETIELPVLNEGTQIAVRLGDLMKEERVVLANLYIGRLAPGRQVIANVQVRYDDPVAGQSGIVSEKVPVFAEVQAAYVPSPNPEVQNAILALAKYRQTQIAEAKLQQGDRVGAATMLQTAAKTALQLGDNSAATVLQRSATQLQSGEDLSESDRKKTRIVSKTILQE